MYALAEFRPTNAQYILIFFGVEQHTSNMYMAS
jgi:hypothetical protein